MNGRSEAQWVIIMSLNTPLTSFLDLHFLPLATGQVPRSRRDRFAGEGVIFGYPGATGSPRTKVTLYTTHMRTIIS